MPKRIPPALVLLLLAPLIGEYLLGNLPLAQAGSLTAFPALVLMYGGGAVVIREVARRSGRGGWTIAVLALAYGVVEEGLVTQSLFNPHYLGSPNLSYGHLPALGMGAAWTLFVLSIHVAGSIAVPIAITEALFPGRARAPWLGNRGLAGAIALYVLGVLAFGVATMAQEEFVAGLVQLGGAAVVAVALVVIALTMRRSAHAAGGRPPWRPVPLAAAALVLGSLHFLLYQLGATERLFPTPVEVAGDLAVLTGAIVLVVVNARRAGWSARHRYALAAGAVLTYCWAGFLVQFGQYGMHPVSFIVQVALVSGAVALLAAAARRVRRIA